MSLTIHLDCPKNILTTGDTICVRDPDTQVPLAEGEATRNASGAWRLKEGNEKPADLPWQQRYVGMACQPWHAAWRILTGHWQSCSNVGPLRRGRSRAQCSTNGPLLCLRRLWPFCVLLLGFLFFCCLSKLMYKRSNSEKDNVLL